MENQDKQNATEQEQNKNANIIPKEETVEIKSQENVLSGLSEKERVQAAEAAYKNTPGLENEEGLSEKERANAAEADGKIDDETKGGLSDKERRDAADESW